MQYKTSPFVRVFPALEGKSSFVLHVLNTGVRYSAPTGIVDLLNRCCVGMKGQDIIDFIKKELPLSEDEIQPQFESFVRNEILLSEEDFQDHMDKYEDWYKYNWKASLNFLVSSGVPKVADKADKSVQKRIIEKYVKISMPEVYKNSSGLAKIQLEPVNDDCYSNIKLCDVLLSRRTSRNFYDSVALTDFSDVLGYSSKKAKAVREKQLQEYEGNPSILIDSLFVPFEIYFIANKMDGLENGVYHYDIKEHALNVIQKGDFVDKISKLVHGQRFLERTAALVLITADFSRYNFRHRQERAYRNLLITGSEFAHDIILNCTAKGIKTFQSPAMTDELAEELLNLKSGMEEPIYLIGVGK